MGQLPGICRHATAPESRGATKEAREDRETLPFRREKYRVCPPHSFFVTACLVM